MAEKDLEAARMMVAKEDETIILATDEYLANNRPLWQSVVSHAMSEYTNCVRDRQERSYTRGFVGVQ